MRSYPGLPDYSAMTKPIPALGLILTVLALALTVIGCEPTAGFGEYSGVNLIESRSFSATDENGNALWQVDDNTGTYMTWEQVSSVARPAGIDGDVYRLEINNLLPNGDFEDPTLPGFWSAAGAAAVGPIDAGFTESLTLDVSQPGDQVFLDLAAGLNDGLVAGASYALLMRFINIQQSFLLELNDGIDTPDDDNVRVISAEPSVAVRFPGENTSVSFQAIGNTIASADFSTFDTLSFGGFTTGTGAGSFLGQIDDVRIVRTDQTTFLRLPIPYYEEGRPHLISGGIYTFSVRVRQDPTAGSGNRFATDRVSLGITNAGSDSPTTAYIDVHDTSEVGESWVELRSEFPGPTFLAPNEGDTVILNLVIEPTASQGNGDLGEPSYYDAGSVLVASPSLSWRAE